ncbi:DUF1524 domain-containing protein [Microbacteriaceae bacterium VKM Ac-2855]|nr:DUF1524 domain-containing protein [Microbacteriaceae bacterium VKM Ac-2855]
MTHPPLPPAAWYPDPADPTRERWWDGERWAGSSRTPIAIPAGKRRLPLLTVIVGGIVAVLALTVSISSGIGGVLALLGLAVLITGLYALVTRRPTWLRLRRSRKLGAAITAGGLVAIVLGAGLSGGSTGSDAREKPTVASATPMATASTAAATPAAATPAEPMDPDTSVTPPIVASVVIADSAATSSITVAALLDTLPVKGKAPKTGYERTDDFGAAWLDVDRNGCDTRNDILARDLTNPARSGVCRVVSGTLVSPYTGDEIDFVRGNTTSQEVAIDHVVPLLNAWITGAQQLTLAQRVSLANDPINLLAVDRSSNSQKSAGDAATWLPADKAYRCDYVARQVSVKATYGLWVTEAEKTSISRVLSTCPEQLALTSPFAPAPIVVEPAAEPEVAAPVVAPEPITIEAPAPAVVEAPAPAVVEAPAPAEPSVISGVSPGGYCGAFGAIGVADNGKSYQCGGKGADANGKYHWNAM